jgi:hypothetical protein
MYSAFSIQCMLPILDFVLCTVCLLVSIFDIGELLDRQPPRAQQCHGSNYWRSYGSKKMKDGSCHHLPYPTLPYYYWTAATAGNPPLIPSYTKRLPPYIANIIHPTIPHWSTSSCSIVTESYSCMQYHIVSSAVTNYYSCMHSLLHNTGYSRGIGPDLATYNSSSSLPGDDVRVRGILQT